MRNNASPAASGYSGGKASIAELVGGRRLLIEGHRGVQRYCSQCIQVHVSFGILEICGDCLTFRYMTSERLLIEGSIESMQIRSEGCYAP